QRRSRGDAGGGGRRAGRGLSARDRRIVRLGQRTLQGRIHLAALGRVGSRGNLVLLAVGWCSVAWHTRRAEIEVPHSITTANVSRAQLAFRVTSPMGGGTVATKLARWLCRSK